MSTDGWVWIVVCAFLLGFVVACLLSAGHVLTKAELSQAIPPAYTEHIGGYLMAEVNRREAAAA